MTGTFVALGFFALSGLCLLVGAVARSAGRRRRRDWVSVEGVVVGEQRVLDSHAPVIAFRAMDGREVRGTPRVSSDTGISPQGRVVPVVYDPQDPERFHAEVRAVDRPGRLMLLLAVPFALIGAAIAWVELTQRHP